LLLFFYNSKKKGGKGPGYYLAGSDNSVTLEHLVNEDLLDFSKTSDTKIA
jgi:hypothetical protein